MRYIVLAAAALGCSTPDTTSDAGFDASTVDVTSDGTIQDASKDAPSEATSFCTSVDAAVCVDFDLYPYIFTQLVHSPSAEAGLDTTTFVSAPASLRLYIATDGGSAGGGAQVQATGSHVHVEADVRIVTTTNTVVSLMNVSHGSGATGQSFGLSVASNATQVDIRVANDAGGTMAYTTIPGTAPPLSKWTHLSFDAVCTQSGSLSVAFDGTTVLSKTGIDLSQVANANFGVQFELFALTVATDVEVHVDNVVGTMSP